MYIAGICRTAVRDILSCPAHGYVEVYSWDMPDGVARDIHRYAGRLCPAHGYVEVEV